MLLIGGGTYYYLRESRKVVEDERSVRIVMRAGTLAFMVSWGLLGLLAILTTSGALQISFELIVWAIWLVMPWTFILFRFILNRSGEVA